ncbi:PepSY domain-containing protein [Geminocystis sp. NIES-3709]|uniref:PepSY domain-containing protein n=1 Tax=Geminocystis sp. NIES-3709 TaxID=1617448 RepID=UPI0005FC817C|nr:PepSY domain-containing protein [Geminocystis sp. NIES-3709]BAQ64348.1 hypothetical protein GM3709_1113 [Geminocystis sp. NIES-3709]
MANLQIRKLHRKFAPILFLPLLITALTGVFYRVARSWFGLSDELGENVLALHEGKFLGEPLVPFYVLFLGLGLLAMIVTGLMMFKQRKQKAITASGKLNFRLLHSFLAPILFLPLLISATTGIAYRLGETGLGLSEEQIEILMDIHQGNYLGSFLRVIYVLLVGFGLLGILVTGIQMTGLFRKRSVN